jgi:hypothetical protein
MTNQSTPATSDQPAPAPSPQPAAAKQPQRDIVLEPLVGFTESGEQVCHALEQIFLNGIRLGYVGHGERDPINFIRPGVLNDKETLALIVQKVHEKLGGAARKINGVPEITDEEALDLAEGVHTDHDED